MTESDKRPVGRPRKYAGKRPTWTIRLEEKYGDWIKSRAAATGRSLSEVCEQQIVASFRMESVIDILEEELRLARIQVSTLSEQLKEATTAQGGKLKRRMDPAEFEAIFEHMYQHYLRSKKSKNKKV